MAAEPVNIFEYEEIARERIQKGDYDYIAGGATDEITVRRTRAVYDSIMLRPRMMVDVAQRSLATTVLGHEIALPVMLDPAGNHESAHPDAEIASVKAAGAAGTLMVLSSHASRTLEDVAASATGPLWFQQYFFKDRGITLEMAARAEEAGYSAICMTLDAKIAPKRERNIRNNAAREVGSVLEGSRLRRQDDVGHHRNLGVDGRRAVDCADDRRFDLQQVGQQPFALPVCLVPVPGHSPSGTVGLETSAVVVNGTGEDDHPVVRVRTDVGEGVTQFPVGRLAPKQTPVPGVKRHLENPVLPLHADRLVFVRIVRQHCHGYPPVVWACGLLSATGSRPHFTPAG